LTAEPLVLSGEGSIGPPRRTLLAVAGRTGDWAAIDLKGDGLIDGFAHAAFLGSGD